LIFWNHGFIRNLCRSTSTS